MQNSTPLQSGEQVVITFRRHWFFLFLSIAKVLLGAMLPFIGYAYLLHIGAVPPGLRAVHVFQFTAFFWLLIIWWVLSSEWTKYYLEFWIVTNRRVIGVEQHDYFDRNVTAWSIENILEVSAHVGNLVETFLNYGALEIHTAGLGDSRERIKGVPDPGHIREVIMSLASRVSSLETANRNQEQLLHTISHEVKSYLTKDAASLATIASGDIGAASPEVRDFAQIALSETRKGVSAVIDMLKGSDTQSGTMRLSQDVFDLAAKLSSLYAEFKVEAQRKGLMMTISSQGPCLVRGDEKKLMDLVFRNVVDNSIRYTPKGSVTITLSKTPNSAVCVVTDTGVGISQKDMAKLFTEGGHGEHSADVNPDSTGFGLASAKAVVEAHGGTIHAMSEGPGRGSSFVITLPLTT